ncbi:MAG: hypothetical protein HQK87_07205, partial [Nitrospinae bacterium]|nr:hypothetical protein [Nitrospinota bacterium]
MGDETTQAARRDRILADAKRIVVKIGSGVLTGETYDAVDEGVIARIAGQVAALIGAG